MTSLHCPIRPLGKMLTPVYMVCLPRYRSDQSSQFLSIVEHPLICVVVPCRSSVAKHVFMIEFSFSMSLPSTTYMALSGIIQQLQHKRFDSHSEVLLLEWGRRSPLLDLDSLTFLRTEPYLSSSRPKICILANSAEWWSFVLLIHTLLFPSKLAQTDLRTLRLLWSYESLRTWIILFDSMILNLSMPPRTPSRFGLIGTLSSLLMLIFPPSPFPNLHDWVLSPLALHRRYG